MSRRQKRRVIGHTLLARMKYYVRKFSGIQKKNVSRIMKRRWRKYQEPPSFRRSNHRAEELSDRIFYGEHAAFDLRMAKRLGGKSARGVPPEDIEKWNADPSFRDLCRRIGAETETLCNARDYVLGKRNTLPTKFKRKQS